MRITSDFFISALIRRVMGAGGFAALKRRGALEAGAIFIIVDRLDGTSDFYGPAPQSWFEEAPDGRLFEKVLSLVKPEEIAARLASEARMDPDFWAVEIEARDGLVDLPLVAGEGPDDASDETQKGPPEDDPNSYFKF
ncbi:DUF1491 family protein [Roseibium sp. CAU 1637]|uniref:DUF1491 family protein n=1 Tax=Roseibium limicola TaxID=2816037 RepID=A0A939ENN6_9HYPH|nr:DUF1491 family protein [Roseibium limicola]MBO0345227.1 DUF1491 family protein [Roseibium limicola]